MKCLITRSSQFFSILPIALLTIATTLVSMSANAASDYPFVSGQDGANLMAATAPVLSVKPTLEQAVCLKREYSEDHLRQYPKQKLSSMYVIVRKSKFPASAGPELKNETYIGAEVIGQKSIGDKEYYANWDSTCEFNAKGSAHCFVECDGGSFDLQPRTADVLFTVGKDYYFPLYRPGMSRNDATDADTISLDAKDKHNAIYRLNQAPVRECIDARKRAKKVTGDC